MPLVAGARLGIYEILSPLGAGGMGEVWRARDTTLNRDVALKILPSQFPQDPDRLARFKREAQVLASLNHPNIATVHGFEQADGIHALVMELVEGPTLADRIAKGPIPVEEALQIARQMIDGIEAAHEHGIIHRDLKPANISVRPDGTVKLLDFGLAKAVQGDSMSVPSVSISPTLTSPAMSQEGIIIGTAAYMSAEQARGKPVDKRADIWAFGCVLYEMLTGGRAFGDGDVTETLAAVLRDEPDWSRLPPTTPEPVRRLLRRCVVKDPRGRLHDIADARLEFDERTSEPAVVPARNGARLPWPTLAIGGVAAAVAGAIGARMISVPVAVKAPPTHVSIGVEPATQIAAGGGTQVRPSRPAISVSPDGRMIVFAGTSGTTTQLFLRSLDKSIASPIAGTEGASTPEFSPDGTWVAFAASGKLKKVPAAGGPVSDICDLGGPVNGITWGSKGTIAFSVGSSIRQVASSEGTPRNLITADASQGLLVILPHWLPDERGLVYTANVGSDDWSGARVMVAHADGTDQRTVAEGGTDGRYIASGHLLYAKSGTLMALPFDANTAQPTGASVAVADNVMQAINDSNTTYSLGSGQFSVGGGGTLAYIAGGVFPERLFQLTFIDRRGIETPIKEPPGPIFNPRLSPDGQRLAYARTRSGLSNRDIYVYDLVRSAPVRLTLSEPFRNPLWSHDGEYLYFASMNRDALYRMRAIGSNTPERLTPNGLRDLRVNAISNDSVLAYVAGTGEIWTLAVNGDRMPTLFLRSAYSLVDPAISPDGKWMAYSSNETGRTEVYVEPFPGHGSKTRVSLEGGRESRWSPNGRELFYTQSSTRPGDLNETMWAVDFDATNGFQPRAPHALFSGPYMSLTPANYDFSADGQRFIMAKIVDNGSKPVTRIEIVQNWFTELQQRVPTR